MTAKAGTYCDHCGDVTNRYPITDWLAGGIGEGTHRQRILQFGRTIDSILLEFCDQYARARGAGLER